MWDNVSPFPKRVFSGSSRSFSGVYYAGHIIFIIINDMTELPWAGNLKIKMGKVTPQFAHVVIPISYCKNSRCFLCFFCASKNIHQQKDHLKPLRQVSISLCKLQKSLMLSFTRKKTGKYFCDEQILFFQVGLKARDF